MQARWCPFARLSCLDCCKYSSTSSCDACLFGAEVDRERDTYGSDTAVYDDIDAALRRWEITTSPDDD